MVDHPTDRARRREHLAWHFCNDVLGHRSAANYAPCPKAVSWAQDVEAFEHVLGTLARV